MLLLPELDILDPLESTNAFDQLMSFVFGPQELQLLHTESRPLLHTGIETFASYRNRDPKHNVGHASNGNRDPKDNVGQGGSGVYGASNGNPTGNVDQPTPHADVDSNGNRDSKNNVGV
ncbi:hypothetical protein TNCV_1813411 [Trichonephila clavipes]|uniref:Uncharacterized protein n=1 Tax=Trichonephila clavipes TaxID=2585209 RepID=A0A8X7BGK9_TRICX|nr:hypothetical protein TNCV_1813411 [Trichonephila clavipes]